LTAKMFSGVGAEALIDRERFQMIWGVWERQTSSIYSYEINS
jgi:hypothetical protein